MRKRRLFYVISIALSVFSIFYALSEDRAEYEQNCLSGFNEKNNMAGIVDYYNGRKIALINEKQVLIRNVRPNEYGAYDYEYSILGGTASGFATGNNCGHEEISPKGPELLN